VLPIVQEKCGACHFPGGAAPMSLLTHGDAVPWGESIRAELMAGHMPPWPVDSAAGRFRNVRGLTARELNVLLTWASGGTPAGTVRETPHAPPGEARWPLGPPDAVLTMPAEASIPADVQERVAEIVIPTGLSGVRWLRAVDVLPGTPAVVRSATVSVLAAAPDQSAGASGGRAPERLLGLWVPGDHPVALDRGTAFRLEPGSAIVLRVRYRKTWEYERVAMTDRSRVGLYFADDDASVVQALPLAPGVVTLDAPVRALAIYPDADLANTHVRVVATRPDGVRDELIAFRPRPGWARRYWFAEPVVLPRGTRVEVIATDDDAGLLPPGALPPPPQRNPSQVRVTLNVVAEP
jgi:hypothetical protein